EKPLADTVPAADELVRRAGDRGVVLQVGHVERFNRAVRAAAPYLEEPRFLQIDRLAPFQPRGTDVAVILDLMIHDLDLVIELVAFGEVLRYVQADAGLLAGGRHALRSQLDDLVILVDYPGYHLRAAAAPRAAGVPVLYDIAPQMWAWGVGRVRKLTAVGR